MNLTTEKREALWAILTAYANDDVTTSDVISAVLGVLGHDTGKTLRDEFAMAAMQADAIQSGIIAAAYVARGMTFSDKIPNLEDGVKEYYRTADAMLEARK